MTESEFYGRRLTIHVMQIIRKNLEEGTVELTNRVIKEQLLQRVPDEVKIDDQKLYKRICDSTKELDQMGIIIRELIKTKNQTNQFIITTIRSI